MDKYLVDDEFLYKHMKYAEDKIIDKLPNEEDLSHNFSKKFKRKMNRLLKEEKRSPFFNKFVNYGRRVAIVCVIAISVIFATTMSIEAYRERFIEKIIEVLEDFTSITFDIDEDVIVEELVSIAPGYVPEGFSVYEEETYTGAYLVRYKNEEDVEINYEQSIAAGAQVLLDTEGVEVEYININNQSVMIYTNKGFNQLFWDDELYMYYIISSIDRNELIEMAESIIANK